MSKFEIGDKVECTVHGTKFIVSRINSISGCFIYYNGNIDPVCNSDLHECGSGSYFGVPGSLLRLVLDKNDSLVMKISKKIFRRKYMNSQILKLFPDNTANAVLVEKHLRKFFDENPLLGLAMSGKSGDVLKEAKKLEEESKKKKEEE